MKEFLGYIFALAIGIFLGIFLESRARRLYNGRMLSPKPSTPLPDLEHEPDPYTGSGD
jgi:hypothetical protein